MAGEGSWDCSLTAVLHLILDYYKIQWPLIKIISVISANKTIRVLRMEKTTLDTALCSCILL